MQRIAIYAVSALALAAALWLVWPSSAPERESAGAAQQGAELAGEPPAAGQGASRPGSQASGAAGGDDASSAGPGDTGPRRIAQPAADAESLAAGSESEAGSAGSGDAAGTGSESGSAGAANAPPPLPVIAGSAPPIPAAGDPTTPNVDPSQLVSDPTPIPPEEQVAGPDENLPRLTPREIWDRVQEECVDCTPEQQQAMYLDIDRKSGIAAGLAR